MKTRFLDGRSLEKISLCSVAVKASNLVKYKKIKYVLKICYISYYYKHTKHILALSSSPFHSESNEYSVLLVRVTCPPAPLELLTGWNSLPQNSGKKHSHWVAVQSFRNVCYYSQETWRIKESKCKLLT